MADNSIAVKDITILKFIHYIDGYGTFNVIFKKSSCHFAYLNEEGYREINNIADSFNEEDCKSFFNRVLKILRSHKNRIIRSYVNTNWNELLQEFEVEYNRCLSGPPAPFTVSTSNEVKANASVPKVNRYLSLFFWICTSKT